MEETYTISAIVLGRQAFRENDSRVIVYSRERGKMTLVARGTGFIKSKLSGHIEPFSEVDLMVARGRRFDYIAGVKSKNRFRALQDNFNKISTAGTSFAFVNGVLGENEVDDGMYFLILDYLRALKSDFDSDFIYLFLAQAFVFKTYAKLGFCPELFYCTVCACGIKAGEHNFDFSGGGVVCPNCTPQNRARISGNALKILRFIIKEDFIAIAKLRAEKKYLTEAMKNISLYVKYRSA